ncbi:MAG TPA: RNA 2',3'-cyclic phosphodiesterase [Lacunisphaera sp.]|jgi:2'-5' RNA ligase
MSRLFVAILPPATVRAELGALVSELPGVRWARKENLHLTLRFVGEVSVETEEKIGDALSHVRVEPFILPVGNVGVFPSRGRAKVLWAGVGNGHTRLFQLRKQVDEALLSVVASLDVHHFQPHFTVGHLEPEYESPQIARFVEKHVDFEAPPFWVREFYLMASSKKTGVAPVYRSLRKFDLTH